MRYNPTGTEPTPLQPGIINAYLSAWRRMFDYSGVSTRQEYWVFVPLHWIILFPLHGFLSGAWIFETNVWTEELVASLLLLHGVPAFLAASLLLLHGVPAFLASVSLTVRRVRDATGSGCFVFLMLLNPCLILGIAACPARDAAYLDGLAAGYWNVWRKSADYLGVAKRVEFWPFTLINLVAWVAVVAVAPGALVAVADSLEVALIAAIGLVVALSSLLAIPWVPLVVRRVRDATGKNSISLLGVFPLVLVPVILLTFLDDDGFAFLPILMFLVGVLCSLLLLMVCLFPTDYASDPAYSGEEPKVSSHSASSTFSCDLGSWF